MSEAELRITKEISDHINSCSIEDLMKLYVFLFGQTETYTQAQKEIGETDE